MSEAELVAALRQARRALGDAVTILGHHYQRDEVIQFADFRGDSLELSRRAAQVQEARYIVFCGVHFMAETAAILCKPEQVVIQPEIEAMCPMAHMANAADANEAWAALTGLWPGSLTPITYQNSTAELKAFVGEHGGAVCTSANADRLFSWAFRRGEHILFMPDEHLGTNTALAMGIPVEEVGLWDPLHPPEPSRFMRSRVMVWKGFCHVHTAFRPEDVDEARRAHPGAIVVVHPECVRKVVAKADQVGSTSAIIQAVERAPAGATIVIGTEWHLVNRLGQEHPDKVVLPLRPSICPNMAMTKMSHLLYALEGILAGQPVNVVTVDAETAKWARLALERMLGAS
jgi:quinolinate synthase